MGREKEKIHHCPHSASFSSNIKICTFLTAHGMSWWKMPAISFEDPLEVNKWTKKTKKIFFINYNVFYFHLLTEINDKRYDYRFTHTHTSIIECRWQTFFCLLSNFPHWCKSFNVEGEKSFRLLETFPISNGLE